MRNPLVSTWAIIAIGLLNSIQFPTIFSLSVSGLGKDTPYASGLLCTCIVGGALVPLLQGVTADHFGLRVSFVIPFLSYLYILTVARKLPPKGANS
jgi:FHS family L-fucose permease-like MFS transporter